MMLIMKLVQLICDAGAPGGRRYTLRDFVPGEGVGAGGGKPKEVTVIRDCYLRDPREEGNLIV